MRAALASLVLALACADPGAPASLAVETPSPATGTGELTEFVGVGLGEGEFAPVLEPPCPLPCEVTASFSTAEDDQPDIQIELYRGYASAVATAHYLGTYEVTGLPSAPAGGPDVAVTFRADAWGLSLRVEERSGIPVGLRRSDPAR